MSDFKIPPISPLSGATFKVFLKILGKGKVSPRYYYKLFLTSLIILIATPFQIWDRIVYNNRLKKFRFEEAPLFIIGHWRSGTTLLHYLLCKDPSAGYLTTYNSLFPNNLSTKWLFRTFMRLKMPRKRPSDDMELNADYPQEDEFAFSNCQSEAFYNFFYFPASYKTFYERAIAHKDLSPGEISAWFRSYDTLLKKALIDTHGKRLIVKNPVNTARIDKILKLYPDAKFLYIYRNPITVFYSTRKFFRNLFPALWLDPVDMEFIDTMILDNYVTLMNDYQNQKGLIPDENLLEIRFEDFENNPVEELKKIYSDLLKKEFDPLKPVFTSYFNSISGYRKNRYRVKESFLKTVLERWAYFIELYGYELPSDLETEHD